MPPTRMPPDRAALACPPSRLPFLFPQPKLSVMAKASVMLELGTSAPDFALPDVTSGRTVHRDDFADAEAFLVMFICRHCPYVEHVREGISALGRDYEERPLAIVAISANDPAAYPEDAPESLAEE